MRIVCISDTHNKHRQCNIPEGDLLIHAGDISSRGRIEEIIEFDQWMGTLPHSDKIIIAGNHDFLFERNPLLARSLIRNAHYLEDSGIVLKGFKIWGSPITPWFFNWAFNRWRGTQIKKHWDKIPDDTDILITHGPPKGILDQTFSKSKVGCSQLMKAVLRVQPKLHIFGHIHEAYGEVWQNGTHFINASLLDIKYRPVNASVVIDL